MYVVFYSNSVPISQFLRYSICNYTVNLKPGLGSLKVIGTDRDRSATYNFLVTFHKNHGPISYRFRDRLRFQSIIAKLASGVCKVSTRVTGFHSRYNFATICGVRKPQWWGYKAIQYRRVTDRHATTALAALRHSVARLKITCSLL